MQRDQIRMAINLFRAPYQIGSTPQHGLTRQILNDQEFFTEMTWRELFLSMQREIRVPYAMVCKLTTINQKVFFLEPYFAKKWLLKEDDEGELLQGPCLHEEVMKLTFLAARVFNLNVNGLSVNHLADNPELFYPIKEIPPEELHATIKTPGNDLWTDGNNHWSTDVPKDIALDPAVATIESVAEAQFELSLDYYFARIMERVRSNEEDYQPKDRRNCRGVEGFGEYEDYLDGNYKTVHELWANSDRLQNDLSEEELVWLFAAAKNGVKSAQHYLKEYHDNWQWSFPILSLCDLPRDDTKRIINLDAVTEKFETWRLEHNDL